MEELYKFMNQSNATLDLKVGNELATEEGEPAEVLAVAHVLLDSICALHASPLYLDVLPAYNCTLAHVKANLHSNCFLADCDLVQSSRNWVAVTF